MFDIIQDVLARMRAQDHFGSSRASLAPEAGGGSGIGASGPAAAWSGGTGRAAPGVVSPTAETVLDEREMYLANSAGFDAKWANASPFMRAMARMRGESVEEPAAAVGSELGAPGASRELRDPEAVIAEAVASSARPPSGPAPGPEKPYTGLTPEEEYQQRVSAMNAKAAGGGMSWFEKAMARARGEAVAEMPITPALGTPGAGAAGRPLRSVEEVIAEAMATHKAPTSTPAPGREKPYSGLSAEEEYKMRRAALDAKYPAKTR